MNLLSKYFSMNTSITIPNISFRKLEFFARNGQIWWAYFSRRMDLVNASDSTRKRLWKMIWCLKRMKNLCKTEHNYCGWIGVRTFIIAVVVHDNKSYLTGGDERRNKPLIKFINWLQIHVVWFPFMLRKKVNTYITSNLNSISRLRLALTSSTRSSAACAINWFKCRWSSFCQWIRLID